MSYTPNLSLPYILPDQAQKHVTHNAALQRLDAIVQLSVISRILATPPANPQNGDRYIVADTAQAAWEGSENAIAVWQDNVWVFLLPQSGWQAWCIAEDGYVVWVDGVWAKPKLDAFATLGINASGDTTNRLVVKSDSALFSHDDITPGNGDVRLTLNKSGAANTASLILQNGYSGRAELGLTGNDDLTFKVSPDGQTYQDALRISSSTGIASFPQGLDVSLPQSGVPKDGLRVYDRFFIDPASGADTNDGKSVANAWKSIEPIQDQLPVGRKVIIELLGDIVWDQFIAFTYPIESLTIRGLNSSNTGYTKRKIMVADAVNAPGYPSTMQFECPANIYLYLVDIELATSYSGPFLFFDSTTGYVKSYDLALNHTGTGAGYLIGNFRSFVPSHHELLTLDPSAYGHFIQGVSAGGDPNALWNFPCNIVSA